MTHRHSEVLCISEMTLHRFNSDISLQQLSSIKPTTHGYQTRWCTQYIIELLNFECAQFSSWQQHELLPEGCVALREWRGCKTTEWQSKMFDWIQSRAPPTQWQTPLTGIIAGEGQRNNSDMETAASKLPELWTTGQEKITSPEMCFAHYSCAV